MRLAQKVDRFYSDSEQVTLWLMTNESFLFTIKNVETDSIIEHFSSKDDEYISMKFSELRDQKIGTKTVQVATAREQFDLFMEGGAM